MYILPVTLIGFVAPGSSEAPGVDAVATDWVGEEHGAEAGAFVAALLASKPHPEQGHRASLGLMRLGKQYGAPRLNAACARALAVRAVSYQSVKSILQTGLDRQPLAIQSAVLPFDAHANVRGPAYYAAGVDTPNGDAAAAIPIHRQAEPDKPAPPNAPGSMCARRGGIGIPPCAVQSP